MEAHTSNAGEFMNRKARIMVQVMALGVGLALGFGANQAVAARQPAEAGYLPCNDDFDCIEYCGSEDSAYCNPRNLCLCL